MSPCSPDSPTLALEATAKKNPPHVSDASPDTRTTPPITGRRAAITTGCDDSPAMTRSTSDEASGSNACKESGIHRNTHYSQGRRKRNVGSNACKRAESTGTSINHKAGANATPAPTTATRAESTVTPINYKAIVKATSAPLSLRVFINNTSCACTPMVIWKKSRPNLRQQRAVRALTLPTQAASTTTTTTTPTWTAVTAAREEYLNAAPVEAFETLCQSDT